VLGHLDGERAVGAAYAVVVAGVVGRCQLGFWGRERDDTTRGPGYTLTGDEDRRQATVLGEQFGCEDSPTGPGRAPGRVTGRDMGQALASSVADRIP